MPFHYGKIILISIERMIGEILHLMLNMKQQLLSYLEQVKQLEMKLKTETKELL